MASKFKKDNMYRVTAIIKVCLEDKKGGDCVLSDQITLPEDTVLVYNEKSGETYRFHAIDGTKYHLHDEDIDFLEAV